MEQSQLIKFRILNRTDKTMNLEVKLRDGKHIDECLITGVEPSQLGYIDSMQQGVFSLRLFPKMCGVCRISGLAVGDVLGKKLYDFTDSITEMTVEY